MSDEETIGDRIKASRERLHMLQTDLARAVGVLPKDIWRYEAGRVVPQAPRAARIAKALGVSTYYLICGEDAPWAVRKLTLLMLRERGQVVVQCLEHDIAAQGRDEAEAVERWGQTYAAQVRLRPIEDIVPAPKAYWDEAEGLEKP